MILKILMLSKVEITSENTARIFIAPILSRYVYYTTTTIKTIDVFVTKGCKLK
jgi:hypothetical protein